MQQLASQSKFVRFVFSKKFDIAFIFFIVALGIYYYLYISQLAFPLWDGAIYLENAQNWLRNEPLEASYRPPLISWIIAGVWSITGEDWTIAKYIQPIFTISAGILLYQTLKKYKGNFFAFGVSALTMLNSYVIFFSTQILTEGLSLFFLVLSIHFLKNKKQCNWILAGIAIGLTFGSRYPIFVLAIVVFIIELIVQRDVRRKLFVNTLVGIVPVMLLIILAVYSKSGGFSVAIDRDTQLSLILSPFYLENFIRIFGFISILLPVVFLFKRTYSDKYNYTFIGWFVIGLLSWSAISENQQERFMIQIMPAAYFLIVLAIQGIWKNSNLLTVNDIRNFARVTLEKVEKVAIKWLSFFPVRFYLCAFVIACISLSYQQHLVFVQEEILHRVLQFFNITSPFMNGELYAEILGAHVAVVVPIYAQLIFLIFFPTIAIVSNITLKRRLQFMAFGFLCFSVFVAIELATLFLPEVVSSIPRELISILITAVAGGLLIELSLWSAISIPKPTSIKRTLKRSYTKEYLLLLFVIIGSAVLTIYVFVFLHIVFDSPLMIYAFLTISSVPSVSYLLGNLIYEIKRQSKINKSTFEKNNLSERQLNVKISFLITAYNEEVLVGKCIASIDRAAAKYKGKTEIIIVNDGSKDNTKKIVENALGKLMFAHGSLFNISNSGKGFALNYGLAKTSGEIIFRMDADSLIDPDAIGAMVEHFDDLTLGSVSGFVFPLEATSTLGKAQNVLFASYMYVKRAQALFDSIIVQPGPCTAFRKDALVKIGGWTTNQFGEDGEISSRIARFGYRSDFEQRSIFYSDSPQSLKDFMAQRSRWSIAYYHSRGRNLEQIKEIKSPRALVFTHNLESHGIGFGLNLAWILLAAAIITGSTNFFLADFTPIQSFLGTIFIKLTAIHLVITGVEVLLYSYALKKVNRVSDIKYYPVMQFLNIIISMWVKVLAAGSLLSWSSKWSKYSDEAFIDLRNHMHQKIDSSHPAAEIKKTISLGKKLS